MKRIILAVFIFSLFLTNHIEINAQPILNETVSDFTVYDIHGNMHNLYDYLDDGKFVCIDFFGVDCESCIELMPVLDSLYHDYGCNQVDIVLLAINYDNTNMEVSQNEELYGITYPAISGLEGGGQNVYMDWNIEYWPQLLLIHPDKTFVANITPLTRPNIDIILNNFGIQEAECSSGNLVDLSNAPTNLEIYPNPTSDFISFLVPDLSYNNEYLYKIIDLFGKTLLVGKSNIDSEIFISNLETGAYFLEIILTNKSYRQKLIIR